MGTEYIVLAAAAAFLGYAILAAREGVLMAAVLCYAAAVAWIIQRDLGLLMAALGGAIALAALGLVVMIHREALTQEVTSCHRQPKLNANNRPLPENIGS